jgi:predicted pyridoxine 5'-phosphate oxidase superfamily flavin-nucleotide-binding protein/ferredoxin
MNTMTSSPFHRGEQAIQTRLGVRDKMERFGQQVIRDYLPQEHRDFYQQLPYILAGHADKNGWPWASMLFNKSSLMVSPHPEVLNINAKPVAGDPLLNSLNEGLRVGLLGIELETRRRNRISAHIQKVSETGLSLGIDQAFGNCPQYIQPRTLSWLSEVAKTERTVEKITMFDHNALQLIGCSDTFFVASSLGRDDNKASGGADVSHRGGDSGFVRIDDMQTLTIPDYSGNLHFNTLGNFIENPKAGLLFVDFEKGHMLTMTGTVEILWEAEEIAGFIGAERLWRFTLDHGFWLKSVLPMRWNKSITAQVIRPPVFDKKMENSGAIAGTKPLSVANEAIVSFVDSGVEQAWSDDDDGTLLEFAEDHGLTPAFGCRAGSCGACKVQLLSGNILYEKEISAPVLDSEILLCCAVPATDGVDEIARLDIKL